MQYMYATLIAIAIAVISIIIAVITFFIDSTATIVPYIIISIIALLVRLFYSYYQSKPKQHTIDVSSRYLKQSIYSVSHKLILNPCKLKLTMNTCNIGISYYINIKQYVKDEDINYVFVFLI